MADLAARATISMSGVRAGQTVIVDPSDPYIAKLLRTGYLVIDKPSASEEDSASVPDEE